MMLRDFVRSCPFTTVVIVFVAWVAGTILAITLMGGYFILFILGCVAFATAWGIHKEVRDFMRKTIT